MQKRYAARCSRNANRNSRRNINVCCDRCFAEALSEHFPALPDPDFLVSCAGTLEEAEAIDVNLAGAMRFTEHFLESPGLRSVLLIASASARNGAEFPRYVASKAGLVGYMKYLAGAVAPRGITCNSISPGGVITPANRHILENDRLYRAVKAETLLGKWAEASEIAGGDRGSGLVSAGRQPLRHRGGYSD